MRFQSHQTKANPPAGTVPACAGRVHGVVEGNEADGEQASCSTASTERWTGGPQWLYWRKIGESEALSSTIQGGIGDSIGRCCEPTK